MPASSYESESSFPPPSLVFIGPDKSDTIFVQDTSGVKTPMFTVQSSKHSKPNVEVFRLLANGVQQPFSTATFSSMSGSITLSVKGHEVKLKDSMGDGPSFDGPHGKLKWKYSSMGGKIILQDEAKNKLARYQYKDVPKLEIFVQGDEFFVDLVVASGVAITVKKGKDASDAKGVATAFKVIGALAGGPGIGS